MATNNILSQFMENAVLNVFRATNITAPSTVFAALFTSVGTATALGTEVSGGSYARTAITFGAPSGSAPATISNSGAVTFPTATASWGTVSDFAIMDASSSGNCLAFGTLAASKTVGNTDTFVFQIGNLVVTID